MRALDDMASPELSAILRLASRGPMGLRGFAVASRAGPLAARRAHDRLLHLGLVTSETPGCDAGPPRIELTPLGWAVARRVREVDALLARGP